MGERNWPALSPVRLVRRMGSLGQQTLLPYLGASTVGHSLSTEGVLIAIRQWLNMQSSLQS